MGRNQTTSVCLLAALALVGVGCGDDEVAADGAPSYDADTTTPDASPPADAPPPPDAAPPDARACTTRTAPQVGAPCTTDPQCGVNGFCLDAPDGWPAAGYCTRTCMGDFQCGDGVCTNPIGTGPRVCLAPCCEGTSCGEAGQSCQDKLLGVFDIGDFACLPANADGADGDACRSFSECAPSSLCQANPFDSPGGYCLTLGCTVGDDSTCAPGGDGHCVDFNPADMFPPACVDTCVDSTDCRQGDGYECIDVGGDVGKVCIYQHADPGDACGNDTDCGDPPWQCLKGAGFPNGYCGADGCDPTDESTCPGGSFCYDADPGTLDGTEYCVKRCNPAADPSMCRTGAGYECTDLGSGSFGCVVP